MFSPEPCFFGRDPHCLAPWGWVCAHPCLYSQSFWRKASRARRQTAAPEQHGLPSRSQPCDCQELLLFAYLNVPFQPALSVETAIFCLIVSLAEVTHRLLTHSLLL